MIGLLFSGQGAQKTGVTQDIYDSVPEYHKIIDRASTILNMDIASLLFDSSQTDKLMATKYCQPVILTVSYGLYQLLKDNLPTDKFGIGLSLGEYSALAASGAIELQQVLPLIKRRGELMQIASDKTPSQMAAVMKVDLDTVEAICKHAAANGPIGVANINTPGQIVIGGVTAAIKQATAELSEQGARVVPLKVSGAFHTPVMQPVQADLASELAKVTWQNGTFPVYSTTSLEQFTLEKLTTNLTNQLVSTTHFAQTLTTHSDNLTAVIEVGPGKTLLSFARKIVSQVPRYQIDSLDKLNATITALEDK